MFSKIEVFNSSVQPESTSERQLWRFKVGLSVLKVCTFYWRESISDYVSCTGPILPLFYFLAKESESDDVTPHHYHLMFSVIGLFAFVFSLHLARLLLLLLVFCFFPDLPFTVEPDWHAGTKRICLALAAATIFSDVSEPWQQQFMSVYLCLCLSPTVVSGRESDQHWLC